MSRLWRDGGRADARALGVFGGLAASGRIHSFSTEHTAYGYAEAFTALRLESDGWTCWTAVQLFPWGGRPIRADGKRRVTAGVEELLSGCGLPRPRDFRTQVSFRPKNPDLVCYHKGNSVWRFLRGRARRGRRTSAGQHVGLPAVADRGGSSDCSCRMRGGQAKGAISQGPLHVRRIFGQRYCGSSWMPRDVSGNALRARRP